MARPAPLLPSFAIDHAGRRRWVDDIAPDATVGDLVNGLTGSAPPITSGEIAIDARPVPVNTHLARSGVRHGSRIDLVGEAGGVGAVRGPMRPGVAVATWVCGPDAGRAVALTPGDHHIGRSRHATIRCLDPALEPHHALLRIAPDGGMEVHQLAGHRPLVVDGIPVDGAAIVPFGARIEIGGSVLRLTAPDPNHLDRNHLDPNHLDRNQLDRIPSGPAGRVSDPGDPWRTAHARVPRAVVLFTSQPIAVPRHVAHPGGGSGTLWPTLLGVAGAAVLALVFGQIMFLLFGMMGAVAAVGTWLAQRVGLVRSRTRAAAARTAAENAFAAALDSQRSAALDAVDANVPTTHRAVATMCADRRALWGVRAGDADAFTVSIGEGERFWQPDVTGSGDAPAEVWAQIEAASRLGIVPTPASLAHGSVVAIVAGDAAERAAVARAMVLQVAASSGPADWQLAIVAGDGRAWPEFDWLVHLCGRGGNESARHGAAEDVVAALDTGLDTGDDRHIVLLLDRPEHLRTRTGGVRRLMAKAPSVACIVLCPTEAEVPAACTSMLVLGRQGTARWTVDTTASALAEPVRFAGISAEHAGEVIRSIAHLTDPELAVEGAGIPSDVGLLELLRDELGSEPDRVAHCIADLWTRRGVDPPPSTPIGVAADGVVEIDLERDGPHGLLAGTTGAGKSELLRSLVLGLAARSRPELLSIVLVDYKGGATFDGLAELPHVVGVVTDLDDRLASRALRSLEAELRRREHVLRDAGVSDLAGHRCAVDAGRAAGHLARLVVVIDEFAGLAVQQPQFLGALLGIAQRGRSLGVHLVLATQRPAGVVSDDIRANTQLRVALRMHDTADAVDVIGEAAAARLPRGVPGRAIMRLGADEVVTFQTARCTRPVRDARRVARLGIRDAGASAVDPSVDSAVDSSVDSSAVSIRANTELELLVRSVRRAAELTGCASPHRPWLPPLASTEVPDASVDDAFGPDVVGVVDDPDRQRRLPLRVPESGHLAIVGSVGSGTTTALLAVAACCAGRGAEVHVLDALGDPRIQQLEDRAGIVRLHERERVVRLLDHLTSTIARRSAGAPIGDAAEVVLCVDGLGAVRAAFERDDEWSRLEQLDHIVAGGVACGVRVVATVSRAGSIPAAALTQIAHRWVFHLAEPLDGATLGVSPSAVPAPTPGRLVVAASGLEAQLFVASVEARLDHARRAAPRTIATLASAVTLADLPRAVASGGDVLAPIGADFETLGPGILPMTAGEHVLVVGPQRSGRSTALCTIATCWQRAVPDGRVLCIAPRRSSVRVGDLFATADALVESVGRAAASERILVVIDDAELVDDPGGRLAALLATRADHVMVIAAGRPEALRSAFGHWTTGVRRSRLGLVMSGCADMDADLLGAALPRRAPLAPRPGLAWMVAEGGRRLVQIARVPAGHVTEPSRTGAPSVSLDAVGVVP